MAAEQQLPLVSMLALRVPPKDSRQACTLLAARQNFNPSTADSRQPTGSPARGQAHLECNSVLAAEELLEVHKRQLLEAAHL